MEKNLQWEKQRLIRGSCPEEKDGRALFVCPPDGLDYRLYDSGRDTGVRLTDFACLLITPQVQEDHSVCFQLAFYEKDGPEPTLRAIFGLIPGVEVPVPFDFRWLDSQNIFPERSTGRQKMTVFGKPIRLRDVAQIRLQTAPGFAPFHVALRECRLLDRIPEISLPQKACIDDLGQWIPKQWPGKMRDRDACSRFLRRLDEKARKSADRFAVPAWDRFGGYTPQPFTKTGWFHVEQDDRRFWLADPEGNAFISCGLDCINPGEGTRLDPAVQWLSGRPRSLAQAAKRGEALPRDAAFSGREGRSFYNYGVANMEEAFGRDRWQPAWARIVRAYLKSWGVNTIGNWSSPEFIRFADMPYVLPADVIAARGFPDTAGHIFRDFPDVFADEFEKAAAQYAAGLAPYRDDPNLIGYFMRNEPAWAFVYDLNLAEEMLANPAGLASKERMIGQLREQYGSVGALNAAWGTQLAGFGDLRRPLYKAASLSAAAKADLKRFSETLISRYVEIPARELRRVDAHHLNLGMRYAYITDPSLLSGAGCFDVFSINSYQQTPYAPVEEVGRLLNKPVMIGEFHHGALDRGLTAHGIRGVTTQRERGVAYRYYMEQAAKSRYFVGAHYFQLNDQSCLGRFDGENYQIGLVDVCMRAYGEMTDAMRACHAELYQVALGQRPASDRAPEELAPVHY